MLSLLRLRMNALAYSRLSLLQPISASTAISTTPQPTQEVTSDSLLVWMMLEDIIYPGLYIDDLDFIRINNIDDNRPNRVCWICFEPSADGTCFCAKHFEEWVSQWNSTLEGRIDIAQFSYAHRAYQGARLPHGDRQLVRHWLRRHDANGP